LILRIARSAFIPSLEKAPTGIKSIEAKKIGLYKRFFMLRLKI
jgi:hypothetical protein